MSSDRVRLVLNFLWYQSIWFACMLTGNDYLVPLGLLIIAHLLLVPQRGKRAQTVTLGL